MYKIARCLPPRGHHGLTEWLNDEKLHPNATRGRREREGGSPSVPARPAQLGRVSMSSVPSWRQRRPNQSAVAFATLAARTRSSRPVSWTLWDSGVLEGADEIVRQLNRVVGRPCGKRCSGHRDLFFFFFFFGGGRLAVVLVA
jgi:hypothetical protein